MEPGRRWEKAVTISGQFKESFTGVSTLFQTVPLLYQAALARSALTKALSPLLCARPRKVEAGRDCRFLPHPDVGGRSDGSAVGSDRRVELGHRGTG